MSIDLNSALLWRVEAACWAAWPAAEQRNIEGWLCRASGGTTRRTNSVNATASAAPIRDVLAGAQAYFEKRGGATLFRLLSFQPAFAHALAARHYQPEGETCTLLADLDRIIPAPGISIESCSSPSPDWLVDKLRLSPMPPPQEEAYIAMLASIVHPAAFARLVPEERGGELGASVAYAVLVEDLLVIESVVTDDAHRGKGLARQTVSALMAWGQSQGARHACLQVVADNEPALALYKRLGFETELYRYQYWRA